MYEFQRRGQGLVGTRVVVRGSVLNGCESKVVFSPHDCGHLDRSALFVIFLLLSSFQFTLKYLFQNVCLCSVSLTLVVNTVFYLSDES